MIKINIIICSWSTSSAPAPGFSYTLPLTPAGPGFETSGGNCGRLQELIQVQLEGSFLGNSEGGGVVGAQAALQDPLLSLFTDLGDDSIGYQEAVPSTDGVGGEVIESINIYVLHVIIN